MVNPPQETRSMTFGMHSLAKDSSLYSKFGMAIAPKTYFPSCTNTAQGKNGRGACPEVDINLGWKRALRSVENGVLIRVSV